MLKTVIFLKRFCLFCWISFYIFFIVEIYSPWKFNCKIYFASAIYALMFYELEFHSRHVCISWAFRIVWSILGCGSDWVEFKGHCYSYGQQTVSWFDAKVSYIFVIIFNVFLSIIMKHLPYHRIMTYHVLWAMRSKVYIMGFR